MTVYLQEPFLEKCQESSENILSEKKEYNTE